MKSPFLILFFGWQIAFGQLTLVVELPPGSSEEGSIYIAGDFQGWNPADPDFRLLPYGEDRYRITLDSVRDIEFKFTRGSWMQVECHPDGSPLPNRQAQVREADTLFLKIEAWADLIQKPEPPSTASPSVKVLDAHFQISELNRQRRIWIYLPPSYANGSRSYPVLYMLDGQNLFDRRTSFSGEWEVDESLDKLDQSGHPTAIVVGIDNGGPFRIEEYTPWPNDKYGGGRGEETLDFIRLELKPYIDGHFRTLKGPEHTGIMGSSLGGLMAMYAGLKSPDVFGKIGAFSPAYWINTEIFDLAAAFETRRKIRFYQVMAIPEGKKNIDNMTKMDELLSAKGGKRILVQTHSRKKGAHNEAFWAEEFETAFIYLFGKGE